MSWNLSRPTIFVQRMAMPCACFAPSACRATAPTPDIRELFVGLFIYSSPRAGLHACGFLVTHSWYVESIAASTLVVWTTTKLGGSGGHCMSAFAVCERDLGNIVRGRPSAGTMTTVAGRNNTNITCLHTQWLGATVGEGSVVARPARSHPQSVLCVVVDLDVDASGVSARTYTVVGRPVALQTQRPR